MSFSDWAAKELQKERKVVIHVVGGVAEVVECPDDVAVEIIDFDNLEAAGEEGEAPVKESLTSQDDPVLKAIDAVCDHCEVAPDSRALIISPITFDTIRAAYLETIAAMRIEIQERDGKISDLLEVQRSNAQRIAELENQLKPSAGREFVRVKTKMITEVNKRVKRDPLFSINVFRFRSMLKALGSAHTADRATDRAEIERLKDRDEMFQAVGHYLSAPLDCVLDAIKRKVRYHQLGLKRERGLELEIERLKADKVELVDGLKRTLEIGDHCSRGALSRIHKATNELIAKHGE